jgi:flagellar assembly protein FliH
MMNILSEEALIDVSSDPVDPFFYRNMGATGPVAPREKEESETSELQGEKETSNISAEMVNNLVKCAHDEATIETEKRLAEQYQARSDAEAARISLSLEQFHSEQKLYFSKIEAEVVHLALAIAAKILHREAQVDPQLIGALVRIAIEKLHDGSIVSVRVSPAEAVRWTRYLANPLNGSKVLIVEDSHLGPGDCILETDLGSANCSISAQLKEVEQGFFDLLAQRPAIK